MISFPGFSREFIAFLLPLPIQSKIVSYRRSREHVPKKAGGANSRPQNGAPFCPADKGKRRHGGDRSGASACQRCRQTLRSGGRGSVTQYLATTGEDGQANL